MAESASASASATSSNASNSANAVSNASTGDSSQQNGQQSIQAQQSQQTEQAQQPTQSTEQSNSNSFENPLGDLYQQDQQTEQVQPTEQVQIPDNYDIKMSNGEQLQGEDLAKLNQVCKQAGLTNEQAQALFTAYENDVTNFNQQLQSDYQQQVQSWVSEVQNDKELGGENFEKTKANIKNVVNKFGSKELADFLNTTGLGCNPVFVRFVNKVGSLMSNDSQFINGNATHQMTDQERRSEILRKMYSNSQMKF
jgi:hypothetical protein